MANSFELIGKVNLSGVTARDLLATAARVAERCKTFEPVQYHNGQCWPTFGDPCKDAAKVIGELLELIAELKIDLKDSESAIDGLYHSLQHGE